MSAFFRKYSTPILVVLLLGLLTLAWLFPSRGFLLGFIFLLSCLLIASLAAIEKHRTAYQEGRLTRRTFIRNAFLEIVGILLAMVVAGLAGRYAAGRVTQPIEDDLLRTMAGIAMGLIVGFGVGALAQGTWGRLARGAR